VKRPAITGQYVAVAVLLAVCAAGRLSVALADYKSLIANDIWQDDAFYYLKVAQNVVAGRGLTFDGHTPTNGFQPLFMLVVLPIMAVAHGDLVWPIHAVGVVLAGIAVATGWLVFVLGRRLGGPGVGFVGLAIWAVSPYFTVFGVNGQETGLALLFVVALPWLYLRWVRRPGGATGGQWALLGLVGGLAVLARLDLLILLVALAVDGLYRLWRKAIPRAQLKGAALAALTAVATWAPWGVISQVLTGRALPLSGQASRLIALNYG
jgi:hypothetical protein